MDCIKYKDINHINTFFESQTSLNISNDDKIKALATPLKYVYGFGPSDADVVLIGEAPGKDEVLQGRPFVGKAGAILDEILLKTGINRDRLYITNVIKYRLMKEGSRQGTFKNRPATLPEIRIMLPWLKEELSFIKPKLILTLGNVPLKALCFIDSCGILEIGSCHGTVRDLIIDNSFNTKLVPLYHPASQIYNRGLKEIFEEDFRTVRDLLLEG